MACSKVSGSHPFKASTTIAGYLDTYRSGRAFNPKVWVADKCNRFNQYLTKHGLSGAVVAVST